MNGLPSASTKTLPSASIARAKGSRSLTSNARIAPLFGSSRSVGTLGDMPCPTRTAFSKCIELFGAIHQRTCSSLVGFAISPTLSEMVAAGCTTFVSGRTSSTVSRIS